MAQLGDHQLQMRDHRFRARGTSFGLTPSQLLRREGCAQGVDVVGEGIQCGCHAKDRIMIALRWEQ
jgi:ubiquinone biosynthesis protein Coq4